MPVPRYNICLSSTGFVLTRRWKCSKPITYCLCAQLSNDTIREETQKVLKNSPSNERAQQRFASTAPERTARPGKLRQRLPNSTVVQQAEREANGCASIVDDEDNLQEPHADAWTEISTAPGSPRSDIELHEDMVYAPSMASDLQQPQGGDVFSFFVSTEDVNDEQSRHRLLKWLQEISQSMLSTLGTMCLAPVKGAIALAQHCAQVVQDVVNWCYRGIQEIHRRGMNLFVHTSESLLWYLCRVAVTVLIT